MAHAPGRGSKIEHEAVMILEQLLDRHVELLYIQRDNRHDVKVQIIQMVVAYSFGRARDLPRPQEQELIELRRGIIEGYVYVIGCHPSNNPNGQIVELELHITDHAMQRHYRDYGRSFPQTVGTGPSFRDVRIVPAPLPDFAGTARSFNQSVKDFQDAMQMLSGKLVDHKLVDPPKPKKKRIRHTKSTEPILAYRDFEVKWTTWDNVWIQSRNGVMWPEFEPIVAQCGTANTLKLDMHDAPKEDCECGIYAFADHKHKDLRQSSMAWGEVLLWGEVFICETGYRAELAYPKTIFVRDNKTKFIKRIASKLEESYGVPVHVVEDRNKTASELLDVWLAQALKDVSKAS